MDIIGIYDQHAQWMSEAKCVAVHHVWSRISKYDHWTVVSHCPCFVFAQCSLIVIDLYLPERPYHFVVKALGTVLLALFFQEGLLAALLWRNSSGVTSFYIAIRVPFYHSWYLCIMMGVQWYQCCFRFISHGWAAFTAMWLFCKTNRYIFPYMKNFNQASAASVAPSLRSAKSHRTSAPPAQCPIIDEDDLVDSDSDRTDASGDSEDRRTTRTMLPPRKKARTSSAAKILSGSSSAINVYSAAAAPAKEFCMARCGHTKEAIYQCCLFELALCSKSGC
jgi:hypothetical protein